MQDKTPAGEFQLTPGAHCATEHRLWNIAVGMTECASWRIVASCHVQVRFPGEYKETLAKFEYMLKRRFTPLMGHSGGSHAPFF